MEEGLDDSIQVFLGKCAGQEGRSFMEGWLGAQTAKTSWDGRRAGKCFGRRELSKFKGNIGTAIGHCPCNLMFRWSTWLSVASRAANTDRISILRRRFTEPSRIYCCALYHNNNAKHVIVAVLGFFPQAQPEVFSVRGMESTIRDIRVVFAFWRSPAKRTRGIES